MQTDTEIIISFYTFTIQLQLCQQWLFAAYFFHRRCGWQVLSFSCSQNISFPSNAHVDSDIRLDWYRFGYLYTFDLSPKDHKKTVSISPGVDIALLDFHYELKGTENQHVNRSYIKGAPRLLCNIDWKIVEGFDLKAKASGSLPISNTPSIINLALVSEKQLFSKSGTVVSVYLGAAYEKIDYKDNQDVPNHVKAEMWPLVTTGLKVKF